MNRIDVHALKAQMDAQVVGAHYLGAPVKRNGRGAWWRCPFHQERSASFVLGGANRPDQFHCFGCGEHGDLLEFVRRMEKLPEDPQGFVRTCEKAAEIAGLALLPGGGRATGRVQAAEALPGPPPARWQEAGEAFCAEAEAALWSGVGAGCLRWLREVRGLEGETVRAWGLGWNASTQKQDAGRWGLDEQREGKPVWIPQGLVIPGRVAGGLWYVKLRPSREVRSYFQGKYYQIPALWGTERSALLGADRWAEGRPVLLLEGELDLLTVWQEARDLVNAATLGGAAKGRAGERLNFGRWLPRLLAAERLLVAFDPDVAGEGAADALAGLSERFEPVRVPWGEDVNGFHTSGGSVAGWVKAVIGDASSVAAPRKGKGVSYPVTLIFEAGAGLAVGAEWRELEDGRIEAVFDSAEELEAAILMTRAIGSYHKLGGR